MNARIRDPKRSRAVVHTRLIWLGMVPAITGLVVTAVGLMVVQPWLAWTGVGLLVAGLAVAWLGGVQYDVKARGEPPHTEWKELEEGSVHQGLSAEARIAGRSVRARARRGARQTSRLVERSEDAEFGDLRRLAAFGLIAVGGWLFLDQVLLHYPFTPDGQDTQLRDIGLLVLVTLSGLRLRLRTPSIVATAVSLACGVALVLQGALAFDGISWVSASDLAAGALVLLLTPLTRR